MAVPQRLRDLAVSETGFLFDPWSGLTFSTNPTGKFVLERLRAGHDPERIETELRDAFDLAEGDDPARDVREFLLLLREQGILSRDDAA